MFQENRKKENRAGKKFVEKVNLKGVNSQKCWGKSPGRALPPPPPTLLFLI